MGAGAERSAARQIWTSTVRFIAGEATVHRSTRSLSTCLSTIAASVIEWSIRWPPTLLPGRLLTGTSAEPRLLSRSRVSVMASPEEVGSALELTTARSRTLPAYATGLSPAARAVVAAMARGLSEYGDISVTLAPVQPHRSARA